MWLKLLLTGVLLAALPAQAARRTTTQHARFDESGLKARASFVSPAASRLASQSGRQRNPSSEQESSLELDQIKELVGVLPDTALAEVINNRGVNFQVTPALMESLRRDGLGPRALQALRAFTVNKVPTLVLSLGSREVAGGRSLALRAEAVDADGDRLQYQWTTSAGSIVDDGADAELDTSGVRVNVKPVRVTVGVTVSDRRGGFASASEVVTVWNEKARLGLRRVGGGAASAGASPGHEMLAGAEFEGDDLLVTLQGNPAESPGQAGSLEVTLSLNKNAVEVRSLTGMLPGAPCRIDLMGFENVSRKSFKETPDSANDWSRVIVRLRPKDSKRNVRFVIGWQLLK